MENNPAVYTAEMRIPKPQIATHSRYHATLFRANEDAIIDVLQVLDYRSRTQKLYSTQCIGSFGIGLEWNLLLASAPSALPRMQFLSDRI